MTQILVADPHPSICNALKERLEMQGCCVKVAMQKQETLNYVSSEHLDIILCEQNLFNECCSSDKNSFSPRSLPTIILSSEDSLSSTVSCVQQGAQGVITKPIDMKKLNTLLSKIIEQEALNIAKSKAKSEPKLKNKEHLSITGNCPMITKVRAMIDKVAPSDARVLILGANGTGKEIIAHTLHDKSSRHQAPFVEVNCAAIPTELIESELFGHEKGAFTSAFKLRKGKFEQADGGTLFLDEIGDMSLSAQAKVLRALQERRISRVGSDKDITVNVRVIAATNKDLEQEIKNGNFREDLYHRLSVIIIRVPSLDDRRDDIPMLVNCFLREIAESYGIKEKTISKDAMQKLKDMHWSGNIRQLRNVVERLIILSEDEITTNDIELYTEI